MSLAEIFADNNGQHQELAEHATRYGAITIGPRDQQYLLYRSYQIPREDWIIVPDGSVGVTTRDFRFSKERMEEPHMKALLWALHYAGAEIVSSILDESFWGSVWKLLESLQTVPCSVLYNHSTSTHIHVGILVPNEEISESDILQNCRKLAAVWYIFETYINLIHPEHRVNDFSQRSRRSPLAEKCNQRQFVQKLIDADSAGNIHFIINNVMADYENGEESLVGSRFFGASFENLENDKKFTIEFRAHEGTKDFDAVQCWGKLVMRLFDQAAASDWEYIWKLVSLTDGLSDRKCYGPEKTRPFAEWKLWVQHMHYLFVNFLAGERMRGEYLQSNNPGSLEAAILPLQGLVGVGGASTDPHLQAKREEELLIKRLAIYMTNRRTKFKKLHEARFLDWENWDSEGRRDPKAEDYMDYPNPSGIVRDEAGRDIPINWLQPEPEEMIPTRLRRRQ